MRKERSRLPRLGGSPQRAASKGPAEQRGDGLSGTEVATPSAEPSRDTGGPRNASQEAGVTHKLSADPLGRRRYASPWFLESTGRPVRKTSQPPSPTGVRLPKHFRCCPRQGSAEGTRRGPAGSPTMGMPAAYASWIRNDSRLRHGTWTESSKTGCLRLSGRRIRVTAVVCSGAGEKGVGVESNVGHTRWLLSTAPWGGTVVWALPRVSSCGSCRQSDKDTWSLKGPSRAGRLGSARHFDLGLFVVVFYLGQALKLGDRPSIPLKRGTGWDSASLWKG